MPYGMPIECPIECTIELPIELLDALLNVALNSLLNALANALLDALFNSSEHTQMMVKDVEFYKFWLISGKMINDVVAINSGEHTHTHTGI